MRQEPEDSAPIPEVRTSGVAWGALAALVPAFALLFALSMSERLDHDEHQFIASAALLARRGLLPYRDYPYFHAPYLVFLYAGLFRIFNHLLLTARLLSMLCSFGSVSILFLAALRQFKNHGRRLRFGVAVGMLLLAMANPVFTATSGRSWNHDVPTFLMLLALLAMERGVKQQSAIGFALIAGLLMGTATGVRLTFAPSTLAFLTLALVAPGLSLHRRCAVAGMYSLGTAVALAPALTLLFVAPRQFLFGNFGYAALNTAAREVSGYTIAMTPAGKLAYLFSNVLVQPGSFAIIALLVATAVIARLAGIRLAPEHRARTGFLLTLLCATLIGSFAPTPLFRSYFFAPLPLVLLLILYLAEQVCGRPELAALWARLGAGAVIISLPMAAFQYVGVVHLASPRDWVPVRVYAVGQEIAATLPQHASVLTVSPIPVLEGGEDVFEQFATGPFALRVVPLVSEEDETRFKMLDEDDLRSAFLTRFPRAVLTGSGAGLDAKLLVALADLNLEAHVLSNGCILWCMRT